MTFVKVNCFQLIVAAMFSLAASSCKQRSDQPPYSPKDALSTFQLPEGYRIELVASEPLITNPVEIAFDEDGKMYAVQMDDYPSEVMKDYPVGENPTSKIMLLEDKDGDGFYESGSVFANNLRYANGVMPWKGGVLVSSAPDILFLKDTDGDGKADIKNVVLTGFAVSNPQLMAGSLRYGIDNWIYGAYSTAGGGRWRKEFEGKGSPLRFPERPEVPQAKIFPGTNFRFIPEQFKVEPSGGTSQFGLSFDSSGNQFINQSNLHIRHVVINDKYLLNNPFLSVSNTMDGKPDHGDAGAVYPITRNMLNLHESEMGHFTSACGNCIYTGNLFEGKYSNASFVCEPVSNIVHSDMLQPKGATFVAKRLEEKKEFLASTDSWFRPVNLTVGPDGGLYVVDFYRKLVEHPDWLSIADSSGFYTHAGEIKESDFLEGNDLGRVFRIVPKDFKADKNKVPRLSTTDTRGLVEYLSNPNMWWRMNAQRLLVDRKDTSAVSLIRNLLNTGSNAEGTISCLWTLEGLNALTDDLLLHAFQDASPLVKKHALLLAESRLTRPGILREVINASSDSNPFVQLQVALTLSELKSSDAQVIQALNRIISSNISDEWFQTAVLLSASSSPIQWFNTYKDFKTKDDLEKIGKVEFLKKIASIVGSKYNAGEMSLLVKTISASNDTTVVVSCLKGMIDGMKRNSREIYLTAGGQQALISLISDKSLNVREAAVDLASRIQLKPSASLSSIIGTAKATVSDTAKSIETRIIAIQIVGLDPQRDYFTLFDKLLQPGYPSDIQLAVVNVLLKSQQHMSTEMLLRRWNVFNAKVHDVMEAGFLANPEMAKSLIAAVETNKIKPSAISRNAQNRFLEHADSAISKRAKTIFKSSKGTDRSKLVIDYNKSTTVDGDAVAGKAIFKTSCSVCHRLEGVGANFAPDLYALSNQPKINLLKMILDPNNTIAAGYEGYTIETVDGKTLAGIIRSENNLNLTLKSPGDVVQTVLKGNIKSITPMSLSLMPEGFENSISKDDMANLLTYLKTLK